MIQFSDSSNSESQPTESPAGNNQHLVLCCVLSRNKVFLLHSSELRLLYDGEMPELVALAIDEVVRVTMFPLVRGGTVYCAGRKATC